jgi:hypothetical protein
MTLTDEARIEHGARRQVRRDEARLSRRSSQSLGEVATAFWRHPSPWIIGGSLLAAAAARSRHRDFAARELAAPAATVVLFPAIEWAIHVAILHWRPRRVGGVTVDSLVARKHREHHADPRDLPLVFIPWQTELQLIAGLTLVARHAFPERRSGLTFLTSAMTLLAGYEWTHYLVHSDYRPRSRAYRAVWRNHRLHHYKNEHYWFTVTSAGTADRLLGTYPDPADVPTSPTARDLHGARA